jgi:beta-galactosidase GanA
VVLNGMTLMNWEVINFPLDENWITSLKKTEITPEKHFIFFKGTFNMDKVADTYIDLSNYKKGYVWVNGKNLGRYWEIGPQKRLFCPVGWLRKGINEILVLDLQQKETALLWGARSLR